MIRLIGKSEKPFKKQGISRGFEPYEECANNILHSFIEQFETVQAIDADSGELIDNGALVSTCEFKSEYKDGEELLHTNVTHGPLYEKMYVPF
jgi:hypothetical protein